MATMRPPGSKEPMARMASRMGSGKARDAHCVRLLSACMGRKERSMAIITRFSSGTLMIGEVRLENHHTKVSSAPLSPRNASTSLSSRHTCFMSLAGRGGKIR